MLTDLLNDLDGVMQDPVWHPEGDALFHSLQVWAHARQATDDPELWAAALLHDVGKGMGQDHERIGAQLLDGWVSDRVCWLVLHHLDLMRQPTKIKRKYRGSKRLTDLVALRKWDEAGRDKYATVASVQQAMTSIAGVILGGP